MLNQVNHKGEDMGNPKILSKPGNQCVDFLYEMFKNFNSKEIEDRYGQEFYSYYKGYLKDINRKKFEGMVYLYEQIISDVDLRSKKMLDLGCGYGISSLILSHYGAENIVGVDSSNMRIQGFNELRHKRKEKVSPILGSALSTPFRSNTFDVIFCNEFISHVSDLSKTFKECRRLLKPGGILYVGDTNKDTILMKVRTRKEYKRREAKLISSVEKIITSAAADLNLILSPGQISSMAHKLIGLLEHEIRDAVKKVKESNGILPKEFQELKIDFKYRDPYTGYYFERLFSPKEIRKIMGDHGFINITSKSPIHYKVSPLKIFLTTISLNKLFSKVFLYKYYIWGEKLSG
jgi:ubiquinone/menaquinone biosynthesis C-methylase UbiE